MDNYGFHCLCYRGICCNAMVYARDNNRVSIRLKRMKIDVDFSSNGDQLLEFYFGYSGTAC